MEKNLEGKIVSANRENYTAANIPTTTISINKFVRILGISILLFGLLSGFQVVKVAWDLIDNQERVEKLADNMENYTNIGSIIPSLLKTLTSVSDLSASLPIKLPGMPNETKKNLEGSWKQIKLTYFAAWVVIIILLSLIARFSLWAIKEGSRLASVNVLDSPELKLLMREVLSEIKKT